MSGWKFSCQIPSWTQASLEGDEVVVFYCVEVKVQPPEDHAAPRTRSVLRRFSHFSRLYQRLREELGLQIMAGKPAPPKRALIGVNRKPDQIERRRKELEQWLWRLVDDPHVARSKMLHSFLELSEAARLIHRPMPAMSVPQSQRSSTSPFRSSGVPDGYAMSEGGSSQHGADTPSELSMPGGASPLPALTAPPLLVDAAHLEGLRGGTTPSELSAVGPSRGSVGRGTTGDLVEDGGNMRLGLHVEQRGNVKKQVRTLRQRIDRAALDLQDAIEAIAAERAGKLALADRVKELEAHLQQGSSARELELDSRLAQAEEGRRLAEEAGEAAREREAALQAELEEVRRQWELGHAFFERNGRVPSPSTPSRAGEPPSFSRLPSEGASAQAGRQAAEVAGDELAPAGWVSRETVEQEVAKAEAKSRAEMKVLAKEIRALRKKLEQEQHKAASGSQSQLGSSDNPPGPTPPESQAASLDQLAAEKQRGAELAARVDDLSSQLAAGDGRDPPGDRGDPAGDRRGSLGSSGAMAQDDRERAELVSRLEAAEKGRADSEAALKEAEEKLRWLQQAGGASPSGDLAPGRAAQAREGRELQESPAQGIALPNGALGLGVEPELAGALSVSKDAARGKAVRYGLDESRHGGAADSSGAAGKPEGLADGFGNNGNERAEGGRLAVASQTALEHRIRDLEQNLADLQASARDAEQLQESLAGARAQVEELQATLAESQARASRADHLQEALAGAEGRLDQLQRTLAESQARARQADELQEALADAHRRADRLQEVLRESQAQAARLEASLAEAREGSRDAGQLREALADARARLVDLEGECRKLREESGDQHASDVASLQRQLEATGARAQEEVESLKRQLDGLKAQSLEEVRRLSEQVEDEKTRAEAAVEAAKQLGTERDEAVAAVAAQEEAVRKAGEEAAAARQLVEELQRAVEDSVEKAVQSQEALRKAERELAELTAASERLRAEKDEAAAGAARQAEALEVARQELSEAREAAEKLRDDVERLRSDASAAQGQAADAEARAALLEARVSAASSDESAAVAELASRLEATMMEKSDVEKQLDGSRREAERLVAKVHGLSAELEAARRAKARAHTNLGTVTEELKEKKEEVARLAEVAENLGKQLAEATLRLEDLNAKMHADRVHGSKAADQLAAEAQAAQARIEAAERHASARARAAEEEREALATHLAEAETQRGLAEKRAEAAEEERRVLAAALEALEQEREAGADADRAQMAVMEARAEAAEVAARSARAQAEEASAVVSKLLPEKEAAQERAKRLEEELSGAQELLAEVVAASDKSGGLPPAQLQGLDRLLQEVETLRLRMAEASAEAAGEASSPGKVLEALDASDARLQVLMAEANLLQSGAATEGHASGPETAVEAHLRELLGRVLHDIAELRHRLNALARQRISSLMGKGHAVRGPSASPGFVPGPRTANGSSHGVAPPGGVGTGGGLAGFTGGANKFLTRLRSSPGGPRGEEGAGGVPGAAPQGGGSGSQGRSDGSGMLAGGLHLLSDLGRRVRDGASEAK